MMVEKVIIILIEKVTRNHLPTVDIIDDNVMIDGRSFFDHPIKNDLKTYDNIRKIATGQGDDYTTRLSLFQKML